VAERGDGDKQPDGERQHGFLDPLTTPQNGGSRIGARLRNWFLTGLIVVGPVSITLYIAWWFIALIDGWVKPLVPVRYLPETYLDFQVPGVGLVVAIVGLILIGALTANLFGRAIVSWGEDLVGRMPIVRNVYRAVKQIFETVLSKQGGAFKKVVLIEFPRKGMWSLGFLTGEPMQEFRDKIAGGGPLVGVFLPTTPNPTTGFLVYVSPEDVIEVDLTIEETAKLQISAGLIVPERDAKIAALIEDAKSRKPEPSEASDAAPAG
jgi:uncharacterized membrane protein